MSNEEAIQNIKALVILLRDEAAKLNAAVIVCVDYGDSTSTQERFTVDGYIEPSCLDFFFEFWRYERTLRSASHESEHKASTLSSVN